MSRSLVKTVSFLAGITGFLGVSLCQLHDAQALSCSPPGFTAPAVRATNIPTNTLLWCTPYFGEESTDLEVRLRLAEEPEGDAGSSEVPLTFHALQTSQFAITVAVPAQELLPNTEYSYACGRGTRSFTTGSGPLTAKPAIPNVEDAEAVAVRDDFGPNLSANFPHAGAQGTIVVLARSENISALADGPSGSVASVFNRSSNGGRISFGKGPCSSSWPEVELGASETVSLGAFDLAGNFSGWSTEVTVTIPSTLTQLPPGLPPPSSEPSSNSSSVESPNDESGSRTDEAQSPSSEPDSPERSSEVRRSDSTNSPETFNPPGPSCNSGAAPARDGSVYSALAMALLFIVRRQRRLQK